FLRSHHLECGAHPPQIIPPLFPILFTVMDESVCARTFCGAGRECVSTDRGEPVCRCLQVKVLITSRCEPHGCLKPVSFSRFTLAVVCFLSDRDWMRERVIQWIQKEVKDFDGVFVSQAYDDGDSQLDSNEFLRFLKHNETALNITYSDTLQTNLLLRSLCVDALIELSDENADWKLSLTEFINCLTPTYHPTERKCALEDEVFEDGAETQMECNKCVCACGNWVCTALTCNGASSLKNNTDEGGEDEEMTEEEWSRRVAELNALQVDSLS
uniref:Follistatin-like 1a n=1 Tax=Pundamilia nyererei TaxID=303518 RepID=A0A3B4FWN6_9CICH